MAWVWCLTCEVDHVVDVSEDWSEETDGEVNPDQFPASPLDLPEGQVVVLHQQDLSGDRGFFEDSPGNNQVLSSQGNTNTDINSH